MYINKNSIILSVWILTICYLIDRIYIDTEMIMTPKITYENMQSIANTGDLVIFRWNMINVGFRIFSKFSHVGMIVKHKDKLYLLETHPKDSYIDNSGVHLYCLKTRLKNYNGEYYFTQLNVLNNKREYLRQHIIKNIKNFKKNIPFDNNFRSVFVLNYFCNLLNIELPKKKSKFCSEFIAVILEKCKIYKHYKNISSINPGSFLDFKTHNCENLYGLLYNIIID